MRLFSFRKRDYSNELTFGRDGVVVRGRYESEEELNDIVDEILAIRRKIDRLDSRDRKILAEKAYNRGAVRFIYVKDEDEHLPIDHNNRRSVQEPEEPSELRIEIGASGYHKEIIALRSELPTVTFRKIASDLKLPLSSVQNEVIKHSRKICHCFKSDA